MGLIAILNNYLITLSTTPISYLLPNHHGRSLSSLDNKIRLPEYFIHSFIAATGNVFISLWHRVWLTSNQVVVFEGQWQRPPIIHISVYLCISLYLISATVGGQEGTRLVVQALQLHNIFALWRSLICCGCLHSKYPDFILCISIKQ